MEVERSVMNSQKIQPEVGIQVPDANVVTDTPPEVTVPDAKVATERNIEPIFSPKLGRKAELMHIIIRVLCLLTSLTAVSLMASAKENGNISIYGFSFPVKSNWSYSISFKYLVVVSAVVTVYSALHLIIVVASTFLRKSPLLPSRNHAWLIFAGDQLFAYAMMSAGSAASGTTNLNRTGVQHSPLPNFCKPLHGFCDRVAASIAFTFITFILLAFSAVLDVIKLSKYY